MSATSVNEIIDNFGSKTKFYDQYSRIQKLSGQMLLERIPDLNFQRVLDLGCGTGFFIPNLQELARQVTCLDASEQMIGFVKAHYPTVDTILGNFDDLDNYVKSNYDLIVSNYSLQWSQNLPKLFASIPRCSTKKAMFAFAFPVEGSLSELKQAFRAIGEDGFINEFYTEAQVKQYLADAKLNNYSVSVTTETVRLVYPGVLDVLRSISKVGASTNTNEKREHRLSKKIIRDLVQYTQKNSEKANVFNISWKICFIIGTRV